MTIAGAIARRSLENPSTPISSPALAEWLVGNAKSGAGVPVSESRVLGLPAYYRGVAIMAGVMAALPLKVYERTSKQRIRQRTVLDSPNPRQRPFGFWQTTYANCVSWGNGYARKERNGADVIVRMWPVHPGRVRVETEDPSDRLPDGKVFLVRNRDGSEVRLTSWEMFHIPYLSPDGVVGVRPLQVFRDSLGTSIAAEAAAAAFFRNGSRLQGILKVKQKLTGTQADDLKDRWRSKFAGPNNTGDIAVLDNDADFAPVSIPPQDAELLESRKWSVAEIARMVGVPPHLLMDVEKSTSWGTGIEQQFIAWVQVILTPWLKLVEELVTADLLPGGWDAGSWYAEYALEGLLRGDSAARAAFYTAMRQTGAFTLDDILTRENEQPIGGDIGGSRILPSNFVMVLPDGSLKSLAPKDPAQAAR